MTRPKDFAAMSHAAPHSPLLDLPIRRALLSVSDKTGLIPFATFLARHGVELLSTGGTAKALAEAGLAVIEVADHTGFPEMLDGRVKTLHPVIHGGLLGIRGNATHEAAMAEHHIAPIDLLVVNLYPFEATVAKGAGFADCVENIDIGGPALIRGAAKNHASVTVVVDVADYERVMAAMTAHAGATGYDLRRQLAATAYARTGAYDAAIAQWFAGQTGEDYPHRLTVAGELRQTMRYGENPHQTAAFYTTDESRPGLATAQQWQGKELSYNNFNDTDAAYELVAEFADTACVIVKHANPCGVAVATTQKEAYLRAYAADTESAFGGILAFNRPLEAATVEAIGGLFLEVIIAPAITPEAKALLAGKKNLRVLEAGGLPDPAAAGRVIKSIAGGFLVQSRDARLTVDDVTVVTTRPPTAQEWLDLRFAFTVAKHVKSNAIVYARDLMTVGVGAGQMSRVNSTRIASLRAEQAAQAAGETDSWAKGSVVASDAFFPFADGLLAAAAAGATAVIQPGGSVRDEEVIKAANDKNLAMVFAGLRHFRH